MDIQKVRVACCLVALIACLPCSSFADEPFPEAVTLVELSIEALTASPALDYSIEVSLPTQPGGPMTVRASSRFRFKQGKFLLQMRTEQELLAVMDGQYLWTYAGSTGHYAKNPPSNSAAAARQLISVFAGPKRDEAKVQGAKVVRSETIEIDGQPHDCWVTQNRLPIPSATDGRVAIDSVWFDKSMRFVLKKETALYMPGGGAAAPLIIRRSVVHLRVNPSLDDSLFVFVPPSGATEVPLSATQNVPRAPTVTFSPPSHMVLVRQVAPVYPELARKARAQGTVRLQTTIGEDGTVGTLKVISGPPLLVEAAMVAVKQWIYKPTMLNGNPVAVMTTVEVNFNLGPAGSPPSKPQSGPPSR